MNKVKIPKFIANYIKTHNTGSNMNKLPKWIQTSRFIYNFRDSNLITRDGNSKVMNWVNEHKNKRMYIVIKAIIDGYEIEEPKYVIKLDGIKDNGRTQNYFSYIHGEWNLIGIGGARKFTEDELKCLPQWAQDLAVEVDE